jgi:membrane protein implicated in regulation of membrane protease activity
MGGYGLFHDALTLTNLIQPSVRIRLLATPSSKCNNRLVARSRSIWSRIEKRRWLFILLAAAAVIGLAIVLPAVLLNPEGVSPTDELAAENALRTTLLQAIAGSLLLAGLYLTWRTFDLNRQGQELDRQGQVTERFTKATDQLGDDKLEIRLGGIYALERLMKDSRADRGTIVEVLTAYVREHTHRSRTDKTGGSASRTEVASRMKPPRTDVQAALTVIGRRDVTGGEAKEALDVSNIFVPKARLNGAHLEHSDLADAHLEGAFLTRAHLERAFLVGAHLEGATLSGAHLEGAYLNDAHLEGAWLDDAHLEGANLAFAFLDKVNLASASYDKDTVWPDGFDPRELEPEKRPLDCQ